MLLIKVANKKFNILIWFYHINKNNITFDCIFTTFFLKIFQTIINTLKIDFAYSRKIIQIINGVSHHKLDYLNKIKNKLSNSCILCDCDLEKTFIMKHITQKKCNIMNNIDMDIYKLQEQFLDNYTLNVAKNTIILFQFIIKEESLIDNY